MSETVRRMKINKRYEGQPCQWCGGLFMLGDDGAICEACENPAPCLCTDCVENSPGIWGVRLVMRIGLWSSNSGWKAL